MHEVHIIGMMLSEWMAANGFTDERLAAELGVVRSTASRIRRGKVIPSRKSIERIVEITAGQVQPNSFFDMGAPPLPPTCPEGCPA